MENERRHNFFRSHFLLSREVYSGGATPRLIRFTGTFYDPHPRAGTAAPPDPDRPHDEVK